MSTTTSQTSSERAIRTALISTDRGFREMVKDVFLSHEGWTTPALDISVPFEAFGDDQVRALRQLNPELVILDIEDAPDLGIKFAQFLSDSIARREVHRRRAAPPARTHAGRRCGRE